MIRRKFVANDQRVIGWPSLWRDFGLNPLGESKRVDGLDDRTRSSSASDDKERNQWRGPSPKTEKDKLVSSHSDLQEIAIHENLESEVARRPEKPHLESNTQGLSQSSCYIEPASKEEGVWKKDKPRRNERVRC